jgi:hypothetical protein
MKGKCPCCGADGLGYQDRVYHGVFRYQFNCGTTVMFARWNKAKIWMRTNCYISTVRQMNREKAA